MLRYMMVYRYIQEDTYICRRGGIIIERRRIYPDNMDKSPSCTMIETQLSGIYPFIEKDELESKWMPKAYDAHMLLEKEKAQPGIRQGGSGCLGA